MKITLCAKNEKAQELVPFHVLDKCSYVPRVGEQIILWTTKEKTIYKVIDVAYLPITTTNDVEGFFSNG